MSHCLRFVGLAAFLMLCLASWAGAAITGDPLADGWGPTTGNSLSQGVYIRGAGNLGFDIYSSSFKVTAGSPLATAGWSIGDDVLAVGGIMSTSWTGWPSITGPAVNSNNVNGQAVLVAKFGTSPVVYDNTTKTGSWSTSTVAPNAGNEFGSSSSGNGGYGTILLRAGTTQTGPSANAGQLLTIQEAYRDTYNGSSWTETLLSDKSFGKIIFQIDGLGRISSWETFLNTTLLGTTLATLGQPNPSEIPQVGDRIDMAFQKGTGVYTDGLTATSAAAPVPEAGTLAIWSVLGFATFGASRFHRRKK